MFSVLTSKIFGGVSLALAAALALCWFGWSRTSDKYEALSEQAGAVLATLRIASDNPDLRWAEAPAQAAALGQSVSALKSAIKEQNANIAQIAQEAVRLRADAARLREIVDKAQAQRKAALDRLADMSATPGTRSDCEVLLREADEALNTVREAGL